MLTRLLVLTLACWPAGGFAAEVPPPDANRVLLGVATAELPGSVRRDFELSIKRGLVFGGLDVVMESMPSGSAPAVATCANAACFRDLGIARGAGFVARAAVESPGTGAREPAKRTYAIKVQVFSARTGQPLVERSKTCEACANEVAAHLGYLVAMDVGQRLNDLRRAPVAAAPRSVSPSPVGPSRVASAGESGPARATTSAGAGAFPLVLVEAREPAPRRSRARKVGVGILGGLGLAAITTGSVLWARGPQSTCPGLPASACGRSYDDGPTGQLLVGVGAAAVVGAVVWWLLPPARATSASSTSVALVPGGFLVKGWF